MKRIKNEHGIKMFYEIDRQNCKVTIYDSNKKYFNDICYDGWEKNDIPAILNMLKETELEEMVAFFGFELYHNTEDLLHAEHICDYDEDTIKENEYVNIFNVNDKEYYIWCW